MATEIRPELSEKNPYWIGKHRYYELKHFCLQYPIWKKAYNALLGLSSRPNDLDIFVKSGQVHSDPTARCAESRVSFAKRMELVEQAAIGTDGDLYPYILRGVTEGLSYKRYDADVFTGVNRRTAAVFQFHSAALRRLNKVGCQRYEGDYTRLKQKHAERRARRMAG